MLLKYAATQVLDAHIARGPSSALLKGAHRHTFAYEPREGYLYVRSRMISSRCNDNYDEFPAEEIKQGYRTFIGKPVFVNHHNEDHTKARGVVIDAMLHEDTNADGTPDTWAEGLMEVDAVRYPKLAKAILAGHIDRTSMGVDVTFSVCSACGNKATTPLEYCRHVPAQKGQRIWRTTASGQKRGELIREVCFGLQFFENSLLVEDPADPTAYFLGKVELGPGLEHLSMTRTASLGNRGVSKPPDLAGRLGEVGLGRDDDGFFVYTHRARSDSKPSPHDIPQRDIDFISTTGARPLVAGGRCGACRGLNTVAVAGGPAECVDCGHWGDEGSLEALGAGRGPDYPDPADHPVYDVLGTHPDHIVEHWHGATTEERNQGMRWYSDAHHIAAALGVHSGLGTHTAAGVISAYSPQATWTANLHNAARSMVEQRALGPGEGMTIMHMHQKSAHRIMGGEDHQKVLGGPKTQDFAHLVEHGGTDPDTGEPSQRVVVDRHAISVASGHQLDDTERKLASRVLHTRHYYEHAAGMYRDAAARISEHEGTEIAPHQVQAVTWLTRQRRNEEEAEHAGGQREWSLRGRTVAQENQLRKMRDVMHQHFPSVGDDNMHVAMLRIAGILRQGYGETKAPADVDTLRDESCPVCGESDSYDGNECKVCGFVQPPKEFQDPDLELAQKLDLRKDNADFDSGDAAGIEDSINQDTDGISQDADGNGQSMGSPVLGCPACGSEFEAGKPVSTDTRDPQVGDAGDGPAEGDVCPACGKGLLEAAAPSDPSELGQEEDTQGAPPAKPSAQEDDPGRARGVEDEDEDSDGDSDSPSPFDKKTDDDPDSDDDDSGGSKKKPPLFPPKKK